MVVMQVRWQNTVAELQVSLTSAVGDVVVAAGAIAYSGPFTPLYRASLLDQWTTKLTELGVPFSEGSSLIQTLADPIATRAWAIAGLPTDSVSVENGALLHTVIAPACVPGGCLLAVETLEQ